jgi:predicted branched-subunit amino acid permease
MKPEAPEITTFTGGLCQEPFDAQDRNPRASCVERRDRPTETASVASVPPDVPSAPRVRDGVRAALPLAPAPFLFGLSFGVLAETAGIGVVAATVMSATTFAGSAQFAVATIFDDGGTVLAAILAAVFLNARYIAIGVSVASIVPGSRLARFIEAQLIVDESWALSGRGGRFQWPILAGAGLLLYVLWVSATVLGGLAGGALDDPDALGFDAAFAVLFLALAAPYLRSRQALLAAALAGGITLVLLPIAPAGVPIVAASTACLIGLRR